MDTYNVYKKKTKTMKSRNIIKFKTKYFVIIFLWLNQKMYET